MKLVRPSREQLRRWAFPSALSWRQARTVFLLSNLVGFGFIGFHGLVSVLLGGASFANGLVGFAVMIVISCGYFLDWGGRLRLVSAVIAGAALPFYAASHWPTILRGTFWTFHIILFVCAPLIWGFYDSSRRRSLDTQVS